MGCDDVSNPPSPGEVQGFVEVAVPDLWRRRHAWTGDRLAAAGPRGGPCRRAGAPSAAPPVHAVFAPSSHRGGRQPARRAGVGPRPNRSPSSCRAIRSRARAPSQRTEVRVLFDHDAIYIGARLFDTFGRFHRARAVAVTTGDALRQVPGLPRSLPRSAQRLLLRRQRRRHPVRRHALQRRVVRRLVGRRLGGRAFTATPRAGPPRCGFRSRNCDSPHSVAQVLGHQFHAPDGARLREHLLRVPAQEDQRLRVAVRRADRAREHQPRELDRDRAVRQLQVGIHARRAGRSVPRQPEPDAASRAAICACRWAAA